MNETAITNDLDIGVKVAVEGESADTWSREVTATKTISTSGEMDYVGAQGDVFVGSSTNIIFGFARNIGLYRNPDGQTASIMKKDALTTGLSFGTEFSYTQYYIENVLIPNFEKMRNSLLTHTEDTSSYVNISDEPVYVTQLAETDERWGTNNNDEVWGDLAQSKAISYGPSYVIKLPQNADDSKNYQDEIVWYNNQIETWKSYLALNEKEKVKAFQKRDSNTKNYSFDSGSSISNSIEKNISTGSTYDLTVNTSAILGTNFGLSINGTGVEFQITTETGGGNHWQDEETNTEIESFNYSLVEEGGDAITVDVYDYGDFGPIFRTRGGQTSAPYEGEVVTKYYEPGTVIMEATMQVEQPDIEVSPASVNNIPSGGVANYTLALMNNSQTEDDLFYRLMLLDETNPDGAILSIDGQVLTEGRLIKIPAGETVYKNLQLRQSNTGILDYIDIGLMLASPSQYDPTSTWDVIADTVKITAKFVPSSSDITLDLSNTVMNTKTKAYVDLNLSDYDLNYTNLKAFRLQYKLPGTTEWAQFREYVVDSVKYYVEGENYLLKSSTCSYTLDMTNSADFPDGTYLFRVASVSKYGDNDVIKYSNEVTMVKDMQKPRPLGLPEPTDGVLDIGDELSITFNEDIIKGDLKKTDNFRVTGVLNGSELSHETALSMQNTASTASTEADISLASKDFSIDAWVYLTSSGTLLTHGVGKTKLTLSTDDSNHLVVDIAGNTYTSDNVVPQDKWTFLTLSYQYTATGGIVNASAVTADETASLFTDKTMANYTGNGPLSIGKNINGAIHELLLWNEARDLTDALRDRSLTKNPSTRNLIGYWKMNEGEGTTIRDYSRNRNMTMSTETWYLDNENKAVTLDGTNYVGFYAANSPYTEADDYAIEMWMKGTAQTGAAQLIQAGEIALWLDEAGNLQLTTGQAYNTANEEAVATSGKALTDNAWHHVALNVLRQGASAVYVDGVRRLTVNSNSVGHIATDSIMLGARRISSDAGHTYDRKFKGMIDEVRVWDATLNADKLISDRKLRLTGKEDGLVAYFPFEKNVIDTYNQMATVGTANNMVDENYKATLNSDPSLALPYTDEAPALRTKPVETSVEFNYTASDNKIVISLKDDDDANEVAARIEGCVLNFTVLDVCDINGNRSAATSWTAFVNQKELLWAEDGLSVETPVTTAATVSATIVNKSGTQQMWTISGMPTWLTASAEYGTTNPLEQSTVTFTVSDATPIGKYEETVYLTSNNGIETPLTISVKVTGEEPLWTVNAADYEESMNLIGTLNIIDMVSEDEDDLVGAFIDNECRGVAHPEYKSRYDGYFVTMDIYANNDEAGKPIEFKVYDASAGIIYPVVKTYLYGETNPETIFFETNNLLGRYGSPVLLSATDEIEQNIELKKGWNWMSLAVKPDDFTVEKVFAKADGKVAFVKNNIGEQAEYDSMEWISFIDKMNNTEMYAVQANEDLILNVTGHRVNSSEEPISVKNGWSWVAFNSLSVMSLGYALADMDPTNDEIIKGHRGVAYFDEYEWSGSLRQLTPGQGYKIQGKDERTFTYPTVAVTGQANNVAAAPVAVPTVFTPIDYHKYPANMVVIAQVVNNGEPLAGVEVGVYAGHECREAAVTDERGMIYITVPGDETVGINFVLAVDGQLMQAAETIVYENDAVYGSPRLPLLIDLGTATDIMGIGADAAPDTVYDLQGRKLSNNSKLAKGVYIVNKKKQVKK